MTLFKGVLKKWENQLEKLEEHCKPRVNKLVAATQYKVVTQVDMQNKKTAQNRDKSQKHVNGQKMRKTSHSEMQFSLGSGVLKVFGRKLGYA